MKRLGRFLRVIGCLACMAGCERTRTERVSQPVPMSVDGNIELRLMSFNVRYENAEDRQGRSWRERVKGIVRMLHVQNPDILGVQEALHGQAADLRASLPDYEFHGVGRDDGGTAGEYSGIFFRADRFQLDTADRGTFWLSSTPDQAGSKTWGNEIPRVAAWVRLLDRSTGRGFYVFNTHWDHRNQNSREKAAKLIAEKLDYRKHSDEPVVLLGDLNSNESNPGYTYLTGKQSTIAGSLQSWRDGLVDTYQALHPGQPNRRTLHFWKNTTEGNLKVDHILVSKRAKVIKSAILSGEMVSDHFPVTADVIFPTEN